MTVATHMGMLEAASPPNSNGNHTHSVSCRSQRSLVFMIWNVAPKRHNTITDYAIEVQFYALTELHPPASVSASICAHCKPKASMDFANIDFFSELVTVSTPPAKQGQSILPVPSDVVV